MRCLQTLRLALPRARTNVRSASSATNPRPASSVAMPQCGNEPAQYKGPDYDEVRRIRSSNLNPALTTHFSKPLLIHQGHMQWLFDHEGNRYLDLFGGIVTVSVGHCHPKVKAAAKDQLDKLWHTTNIYLHPKVHEYAKRLADKLPGDLKVVYFVNSGSEANDMAMMMARLHTGRHDIISVRNAYHGASPLTMGLTAHSTWKYNVAASSTVHHAMNPDPFRGLWGGYRDSPVQSLRAHESQLVDGVCSSSDKYVNELHEVIRYSIPPCGPAALFLESIQGVGGAVQFPLGYMKRAFELVRSKGGLCLADEVQTGFGRTGEHYWGFEGHGVVPDIVTMAKGMGNGFPLAAVVTTPEVAATMGKALHFNTFGGNPMSSAVGVAVMDAIEEDGTMENSQTVGTLFLKELEKLRDKYDIIGDVRGKGLMIGVEFVSDRSTLEPLAAPRVMNIWDLCKDRGVILGRGGLYGNVIRIKPPMCITKEDVEFTCHVLDQVLEEHMDRQGQ